MHTKALVSTTVAVTAAELGLVHLRRTFGSTAQERAAALPGDDLIVQLEPERALVLRSNSHLPLSWRDRARLDWTWTFVLTPLDGGRRTRYQFRSRWVTHPWWLSLGGWLAIVPADFVMSRDMLRGVKKRAEMLAATE